MNAFFYPRLALSGMRRDRRIYAPYLAACVFMTAVVYDLAFLADSPALYAVGSGVNGMGTSAIRLVMTLGKWVMAVFALLFFFYTNAFLIRRRKKELGLMSVLGMDRGALASLLFWETAFSALVSLTAGLALGVLLTQLSARVLSHFARTELPALPLLDLGAVRFCVLTDAFIFFLLLLNAWRQVRRASAVSLLRSDSLGERPPRSQWLLVLPGLGLLGGAYYLAVTITEPITAMLVFFVAVVMVILATFLLFIAGSVTLCRTLQGNDRFYYQKKNFVALSSLVYRMKRSGAGLAVICILSTMILVMLGSTAGLYFGAEDVVRTLSAEMSREIAAEAGLAVDEAAFHVEMTKQRERARAERLAKAVVSSSLVKAAMFGSDANWGRVLCAMGYSKAPFRPEHVDVTFQSQAGSVPVCRQGDGLPFDEDAAKRILSEKEVVILVDLHEGDEAAECWGCDLTYDYVKINGDYRT